jgi:hypothetical protein
MIQTKLALDNTGIRDPYCRGRENPMGTIDGIARDRRAACERLDCLDMNVVKLIEGWEHSIEPPLDAWAADLRDRINDIRTTMDMVERVVMYDFYHNNKGKGE